MKHKIGWINGLRCIAIIGVVWHHLMGGMFFVPGRPAPFLSSLYSIPPLSNGWLGVSLFFFLSGFVLYLPFIDAAKPFATPGAKRAFYVHRARRLLPLFYISLWIGFFLPFVHHERYLWHFAKFNLLVFSLFQRGTFMPVGNWVLWSLVVEIWFSLIFPFIVIAIYRYGMVWVVVAVSLLSLAARLVGYTWFDAPVDVAYLNVVSDGVLGRLDGFVIGMLAAQIFVRRDPRWSRLAGLALPASIVLIATALFGWDYWFSGAFDRRWAALLQAFTNWGCFLLAIHLSFRENALKKFLTLKPLQVVGMMCFSIYAWHGLLLGGVYGDYFNWQLATILAGLPIYLTALAGVSLLSYRFIEFPGRPLAKLFLVGRTPHAAVRK